MESAFSVFLEEVKQIRHASGGKSSEDTYRTSTRTYRDVTYSGGRPETVTAQRRNLTSLNIYVNVIKTSDVHLELNTDECYNITMSSKEKEKFASLVQRLNKLFLVPDEHQTIEARITANTFFGARHGLSTLQQLIWYDDEDEVLKIISTANIVDCPKFTWVDVETFSLRQLHLGVNYFYSYRGLMLDTSRHFFSVDAIKRTLVGMSHSKLNRFHWHLTDSQSFPFVSKYYPELAKYGAYSSSEIYTHDDVKDIVNFAQVRGIQIIPEIDAPAHAGNGKIDFLFL